MFFRHLDNFFDVGNCNAAGYEAEPTKAKLATLFYPYWYAYVNGQPVEIINDSGAVAVNLPGEASKVEFIFKEPGYSLLSRKISLISIGILIILLIFNELNKLKLRNKRST